MKGIVLAGGLGKRLYPITKGINKHLIPIYDKPMIYYPVSTLIKLGIDEILIISTEESLPNYYEIFENGEKFGIKISYKMQKFAAGIADAFIIGEDFIGGENTVLILGDNIFYGETFFKQILKAKKMKQGAIIFGYPVEDPENFGILQLDEDDQIKNIVEKPKDNISNLAIPGIYFLDNKAIEFAKKIKQSERGELEITSLLMEYLLINDIHFYLLDNDTIWFDTGTINGLTEANNTIKKIQLENNLIVGSVEYESYMAGNIERSNYLEFIEVYKNAYGKNLQKYVSK